MCPCFVSLCLYKHGKCIYIYLNMHTIIYNICNTYIYICIMYDIKEDLI